MTSKTTSIRQRNEPHVPRPTAFDMKIAFVHYHLKPGGVSTVLHQQLQAVNDSCQCLVLTGQAPPSTLPADVCVLPGLGYDSRGTHPPPAHTAQAVQDAVHARWPGGCDVLHVHNPLLAKNRHFLDILQLLQRGGMRLFLQIHDFAEDGRPRAYFRQDYPADCHYGVINARDYQLLIDSGLHASGLHLLPNAVTPPAAATEKTQLRPQGLLYPVRAIRRKNIGETILLSLFFSPPEPLYITLPPNSPADMPAYAKWKTLAAQQGLNVHFEAGLSRNFADLMQNARLVLTTSITEGFGFGFMEPWLYGRPLWGRLLPDICRDFVEKGMRLGHLYRDLWVPADWISRDEFLNRWRKAALGAARAFGRRLTEDTLNTAFADLTAQNRLDFAMLDETLQRRLVRKLLRESRRLDGLKRLNPFLKHPGQLPRAGELIAHNAHIIRENYGLEAYGRKLLTIYRRVCSQPVHQHIDKAKLLDFFFDLRRLSLLKWGRDDS